MAEKESEDVSSSSGGLGWTQKKDQGSVKEIAETLSLSLERPFPDRMARLISDFLRKDERPNLLGLRGSMSPRSEPGDFRNLIDLRTEEPLYSGRMVFGIEPSQGTKRHADFLIQDVQNWMTLPSQSEGRARKARPASLPSLRQGQANVLRVFDQNLEPRQESTENEPRQTPQMSGAKPHGVQTTEDKEEKDTTLPTSEGMTQRRPSLRQPWRKLEGPETTQKRHGLHFRVRLPGADLPSLGDPPPPRVCVTG